MKNAPFKSYKHPVALRAYGKLLTPRMERVALGEEMDGLINPGEFDNGWAEEYAAVERQTIIDVALAFRVDILDLLKDVNARQHNQFVESHFYPSY